MANSSEKISVYNLADLKNTSDDAIPNYLNSLKFKQSHFLTDVRLGLGYTAFTIAAACFAWDYQFGFEKTKFITAIAVGVYTVINTVLTLWVSYWEQGTVYEGTSPSGDKIAIATRTPKNTPEYKVYVTITDAKTKKYEELEFSKPFKAWFDELGQFVAIPFQEMLATSVPLIGKCDPKRVPVSQELLDANPDVLDAVMAASSTSTGATSTAAEPVGKQGSKRRKA